MISILTRKKDCNKQKLHRDRDNDYFFIIPIIDNYKIGVLPYSHNDPFPEFFEETKGQVQELPQEMYQSKKIYLKEINYLLQEGTKFTAVVVQKMTVL